MASILIVIMATVTYGQYDNQILTTQEFSSEKQCQYAAKLILERVNRRDTKAFCINK